MKHGKITWVSLAAGALAACACAPSAQAQSADAVIDKLVAKGVLTEEEGKELREESDKNFTTAYQVKSGMPDWVTSLKLNGDVRGRYEGFFGAGQDLQSQEFKDRTRLRYRLRVGMVATLRDNLEAGFRLTSSERAGDFGGDPISGNTTFNANGSKKFVYIDLAYGKWTVLDNQDFKSVWTIGKMENPFVVSDMIFDGDYTPEGAAHQFTYNLNDAHALKLNAGGFALSELGADRDPWLLGAQLRWDAQWSSKWQSSVGVAGFTLSEREKLTTGAVPDINSGNTRTAGGALANNYNPLVADASLTYTLESFPTYKGAFPIKVGGEFLHNPAADTANSGYWAGIQFGKSGKKGTWDLSYRYKYLEGDAWYEEFVDSDFGAYYLKTSTVPGRATDKGGYRAGTNVKGHIVRASYSPYNGFTLGTSVFFTELVDNPFQSQGIDTTMTRLQVDASWKF